MSSAAALLQRRLSSLRRIYVSRRLLEGAAAALLADAVFFFLAFFGFLLTLDNLYTVTFGAAAFAVLVLRRASGFREAGFLRRVDRAFDLQDRLYSFGEYRRRGVPGRLLAAHAAECLGSVNLDGIRRWAGPAVPKIFLAAVVVSAATHFGTSGILEAVWRTARKPPPLLLSMQSPHASPPEEVPVHESAPPSSPPVEPGEGEPGEQNGGTPDGDASANQSPELAQPTPVQPDLFAAAPDLAFGEAEGDLGAGSETGAAENSEPEAAGVGQSPGSDEPVGEEFHGPPEANPITEAVAEAVDPMLAPGPVGVEVAVGSAAPFLPLVPGIPGAGNTGGDEPEMGPLSLLMQRYPVKYREHLRDYFHVLTGRRSARHGLAEEGP